MKKASVLLLVMLAAAAAAGAQTGRVRVGVVSLQVAGDPDRLGVLAGVVEKQLALTLRLLDRYSVKELTDTPAPSSLPAYVQRNGVDNLLYGKVSENGDAIDIELSVFDRLKGVVTLTKKETADSILDVFDASDRLIASVMEGFGNVRVAYGDIAIQNNGIPGTYHVTLNDVDTGPVTDQISKVLAGTYRMKIVQDRMGGAGVLFDNTVEVKEGQTTTVSIVVPYLTDAETARFNALDAYMFAHWYEPSRRAEIQKRLDEVVAVLSDSGGNPAYQIPAARYSKLEALLAASRPASAGPAPDVASMPAVIAPETTAPATAAGAPPRDAFALILDGLGSIPYRQIRVGSGIDGWAGITPVQVRGTAPAAGPGAALNRQIARYFLARDFTNLYVGIEVMGGVPNKGTDKTWTSVSYEVRLSAQVGGTTVTHILQMYNDPGSGQWAMMHVAQPGSRQLEFGYKVALNGSFLEASASLDSFKDIPSGTQVQVEAHVVALLTSGGRQELDALAPPAGSRPLVFLK